MVLTVTDLYNQSATAAVVLLVNPASGPAPLLARAPQLNMTAGTSITLDGSGTVCSTVRRQAWLCALVGCPRHPCMRRQL